MYCEYENKNYFDSFPGGTQFEIKTFSFLITVAMNFPDKNFPSDALIKFLQTFEFENKLSSYFKIALSKGHKKQER